MVASGRQCRHEHRVGAEMSSGMAEQVLPTISCARNNVENLGG